MRKQRDYETTCKCSAYNFPHRFGGGKCNGYQFAYKTWDRNYGHGCCAECTNLNKTESHPYCEVVMGQEKPTECPEVQEFIHFNGIRMKGGVK